MIDSLLNFFFRCYHRRLTRPVAPITEAGRPHSQSYVVCLDCGKQFEYDVNQMRMGKAIDRSHEVGVVPPDMPTPRKRKVEYALLAAGSGGSWGGTDEQEESSEAGGWEGRSRRN